MRHYKIVRGGYILCVGTGSLGEEITKAEYDAIIAKIAECPDVPTGFGCRLTLELEWELYELPPVDPDPELTAEAALDIILGGDGA